MQEENHLYSSGVVIMDAKRVKGIVVFLLDIICSYMAFAQGNSLQFRNIGSEQGLSQATVTAVCQDFQGFMWIGTFDGLTKYDGYTLKIYKYEETKPGSLSADIITTLYEDKRHRLWIGTQKGGLNLYNREKNEFIAYRHDSSNRESISSNTVQCILEDSRGNLWIGTDSNLDRLDENGERFIHFFEPSPESPELTIIQSISALDEDTRHDLWIASRNGLFKYIRKEDKLVHYTHDDTDSRSLSSDSVSSLCRDADGNLWIGTESGLNLFNEEKGSFIGFKNAIGDAHSLSANPIAALLADRTGRLWVGTKGGGLNEYCRESDSFVHHQIGDDRIQSLYEDSSGLVWIGTYANGVSVYNRANNRIEHYKENIGDKTRGLSNSNIWSVLRDRTGDIWIGTDKGLNRIKKENGQIVVYKHDPLNPASLSHNVVKAITQDNQGQIWVGTADGLNRLDRNRNSFTVFLRRSLDPDSIIHSIIYTLCNDRKGSVWIGTAWGLSRYDPVTGQFTEYYNDSNNPDSLMCNIVYCLLQDHTGTLWIGTHNGLIMYDESRDSFADFGHVTENKSSQSTLSVFSLYEDSSHALWIGTWGGGLFKYENTTDQVTRFTEKDGLANNVVYSILEDGNNRLWLSTNEGISRFTPQNGQFKNFKMNDGLSCKEFNTGAAFEDPDGRMFFGGTDGLNAFYPEDLRDDPTAPFIAITDFRIFNPASNSYESHWIGSQAGSLELSYQENIFSIEFAALHYAAPEKNLYAYLLEGFDKDWIPLKNGRYVTYTNIDPGRYTFRVIGSNKDGVWNREGASLPLLIHPPLWRTWWAYCLYIVSALIVVFLIIRLQMKKQAERFDKRLKEIEIRGLKEANEKLKELDSAKTAFFTNISHEFRTPLTLIQSPVESIISGRYGAMIDKGNSLFKVILDNSMRLLKLINTLLDFSKIEAHRMNVDKRPVNLPRLLAYYISSLELYAQSRHLELSFADTAGSLILDLDKDLFEKAFFNLVSNAFKFTPDGGSISVRMVKGENTVDVSVCDTGIGIPEDKMNTIFERFTQLDASPSRMYEGTGIGLAFAREIVELHGGTLTVESTPGKGSTFTISLPAVYAEGEETDRVEAETEYTINPSLLTGLKKGEVMNRDAPEGAFLSKKILVVDDNPDMLAFIRNCLKDEYSVSVADDGATALEKIKESRPDLILTDILLPRMDGYQLLQAIRQDESTREIPLIFLSGKPRAELSIVPNAYVPDAFISKPFSAEHLVSHIGNVLHIRTQQKEIDRLWERQFLSGDGMNSPGDAAGDMRLCTDSEYDQRKKIIFLVEDNEELLLYMKENLDLKYNVFISRNGLKALEKIKKLPRLPDLILSDIMMPVMDGWMFFRTLMEKEEYLHIPFIFLTCKIDEKVKGLSLGAVDYICKPFFMDEVVYKIETLLRLRENQERMNTDELRSRILSVFQQQDPKEANIPLFEEKCRQYNITEREKQIIRLVQRGYVDKEIAYELNLSKHTVNAHLKNIYKKSDTNHRIELINKFAGRSIS